MSNAKDIVIAAGKGGGPVHIRVKFFTDAETRGREEARAIRHAFASSGKRRPDDPAFRWERGAVILDGTRLPKGITSSLVVDELERNSLQIATKVVNLNGQPRPFAAAVHEAPVYSMIRVSGWIGKIRLRNLPIRIEGRIGRKPALVVLGGFSVLDD